MTVVSVALLLIASFLAGSFPSARIASSIAGAGDIRETGSGNPGATNVYRALGLRWALPVLIVDSLKGALPVIAALLCFADDGMVSRRLGALAGGVSVVGHMFSPWTGFCGGKGVATGAGAFTALLPASFPFCLAVFLAALGISRRMSVASLLAAAALPAAFFAISLRAGERPDIVIASLTVAVPILVVIAHRKNLSRLRAGTEPGLF